MALSPANDAPHIFDWRLSRALNSKDGECSDWDDKGNETILR